MRFDPGRYGDDEGGIAAREGKPAVWNVFRRWFGRSREAEIPMLTCKEIVDLLADYLDGTLDAEMARALQRHLAGCLDCTAFLQTYKDTTHLLRQVDREADIPGELRDRLKDFLRSRLPNSPHP